MENKMVKNNIKRIIWIYIGMTLGGAIFIINGGEEPILSVFSKVIGAAIGMGIAEYHTHRKNPKMKNLEKVQYEDERNVAIRDRASFYINVVVFLALFVSMIIGEIRQDFYMTYGSAAAAGLLMVTHMIISLVLSRKM
ncbi:hypothetical protein J3A84_07295 [Proteiniclasticum sp. SCR006]|uniref:DUF2178 domain-containing protein n=1 Tax=Proteiniclasticum aestuarii TaxID=2817862 RepID=A0A939HCL7_9CLOT|nr:hypothetical protein [Proteiniclasticum aestuarii]MBO1264833.1 hypothetical protein [Proteiniclasticum aestuarii]